MRPGLLWPLGLAVCCASPLRNQPVQAQLEVGDTRFTVLGDDAVQARRVEEALRGAERGLARWGGAPRPIRIHVLPGREALEEVTGRRGQSFLKAWAQDTVVYVLAPDVWGATDEALARLLLHEATHCLLFQRSGTAIDWAWRGVPLWFREGMATQTAHEVPTLPTLEDLARLVTREPGFDVFQRGEALFEERPEEVYGVAHLAFGFLLRRYGDGAVLRVLAHLEEGSPFDEAFQLAVGLSPARFAADFGTFLRLRGFRGGQRLQPGRPPPPSEALTPASP